MKIDGIANKTVPAIDILSFQKNGDACGKQPILTLMHIAKLMGWSGKFLDYRNSGDTAGDKGRVVGYGCYAFYK
jgi:AmmeMemoRadiSam system protein B